MKRLALLLLVACGPHLALAVDFGDAGVPPMRTECTDNGGCRSDEVCNKLECSDPTGFCTPKMMCHMTGAVCGCDHVTYANDCDRKRAGIESFIPGPCQ